MLDHNVEFYNHHLLVMIIPAAFAVGLLCRVTCNMIFDYFGMAESCLTPEDSTSHKPFSVSICMGRVKYDIPSVYTGLIPVKSTPVCEWVSTSVI